MLQLKLQGYNPRLQPDPAHELFPSVVRSVILLLQPTKFLLPKQTPLPQHKSKQQSLDPFSNGFLMP
jgi:hypothetical protein